MHQPLVTANIVPSSPTLVTLMMKAPCFSETSILTRATQCNIPEDSIVTAVKTSNFAEWKTFFYAMISPTNHIFYYTYCDMSSATRTVPVQTYQHSFTIPLELFLPRLSVYVFSSLTIAPDVLSHLIFRWYNNFVPVDASQAGEGQLEISINEGEVPNHVQVVGGGRCLVSFTPEQTKPHLIDIKFNGETVTG
jgi:hypothetical protein